MRASFSGLRAGGAAVRSTWCADRDSQPTFQQNKVTPPKKENCFWVFWWLLAESQLLFAPPLRRPRHSGKLRCPHLCACAAPPPACQFWPVGVNKRGEARWVRRGFSPSRPPPRGEGGGGVVDEKDFAPPNAPPFQAHAPWSAMFPQPFAAGVASLRGGWGLVSAIFHIHEHVQWFPRCGLQ